MKFGWTMNERLNELMNERMNIKKILNTNKPALVNCFLEDNWLTFALFIQSQK